MVALSVNVYYDQVVDGIIEFIERRLRKKEINVGLHGRFEVGYGERVVIGRDPLNSSSEARGTIRGTDKIVKLKGFRDTVSRAVVGIGFDSEGHIDHVARLTDNNEVQVKYRGRQGNPVIEVFPRQGKVVELTPQALASIRNGDIYNLFFQVTDGRGDKFEIMLCGGGGRKYSFLVRQGHTQFDEELAYQG
jgi:hypothetical protein